MIDCEACAEIDWNTADSQSSVEHLGYDAGYGGMIGAMRLRIHDRRNQIDASGGLTPLRCIQIVITGSSLVVKALVNSGSDETIVNKAVMSGHDYQSYGSV